MEGKCVYSLIVSGKNLFAGTFGDIFNCIGRGIFLSTNNGVSWTSVNTGLTDTSICALAADDTYLYAGTAYTGVWRRPLSEMITSDAVSPSEEPASFTLEQNHPNPFTSSTTISFTLAERGFVALDIYDLLGNKLRTLLRQTLDAGEHFTEFDAKDLAAGVYVAKLRVNGVEREMKMVRVGE